MRAIATQRIDKAAMDRSLFRLTRSRLAATLALLPLAVSAHASTLTVNTHSSFLTAVQWDYRAVATRNLPGCTQYDVLQRTGWFPSTFYNTYLPAISGNTYRFTTDTGFWRTYCNARMDQYNNVKLRFRASSGKVYEGSFRVIPEGTVTSDQVTCWIDESKDMYNQLQCTNPRLMWTNSGAASVSVVMAN
jgi:hypothetical protein